MTLNSPELVVQIAVATGLGVLITRSAGWTLTAGVVLGLAVAVASTVVLLRVLADHDALHAAVGWLLVENIFTVLVLVMLPILVADKTEGDSLGILASLGLALLTIAALVVFTMVIVKRAIPPRILPLLPRSTHGRHRCPHGAARVAARTRASLDLLLALGLARAARL